MSTQIRRTATAVGAAGAILALAGFGAVRVGVLAPQPQSQSQSCGGSSKIVATLFGNDTTTQIRLSSPDLKTERVLRTEPADRLPAMFESLLSVSPDGSRLAYVTADDEQLNNAQLSFIDAAHPQSAHVIATEPSGMLPIRPVWSPSGGQVAFVVARPGQNGVNYRVLAASTAGGPVLDIGTLASDAFNSLESNLLCVTPAGSVTVLPPPAALNGAAGAAISPPAVKLVTPPPLPTAAGVGGGTRCALPVLSQNDPRWEDHRMQPTGESVGQVGCAVTSAAMVLDYWSANLTPDELSDCLGRSAVPILWSRAIACTGGRVSGAVSSDFTWAALDAILAAGRPAIVGMLGGPVGMHFVVVTSGGGDVADRYHIVDPWNGRSDATLGSYTRRNWTLFQLVDFQGVGPGCGKLLFTGPDNPAAVVGGITDGAWYHASVTLRHLVSGVPVTVERVTHDLNKPDQDWVLGKDLTLSDNGNYRVIISLPSAAQPTVLSFTIDDIPPAVHVQFLARTSTTTHNGATEPLVYFPGGFEVVANDPLTGITSLQAQLDKQQLPNVGSVAGLATDRLIDPLSGPGQHSLTFSATDAAGLSASGSVSFYVQALGAPPPPGSTGPPGGTGGGTTTSPPAQTGNGNPGTGTGGQPGGGGAGAGSTPAATVPGAPVSVTAVGVDSGVGLAWKPPVSDGGSPITGYVIAMSPPGGNVASMSFNSMSGVAIIQGLKNRTTYTFTVAAKNAVGTGPATTSNAATPICTGFALTSASLKATIWSGTVGNIYSWDVQWQGNGTCGPYTGTLTATFNLSSGGTATATYPISSVGPFCPSCSGSVFASPPAAATSSKYVIVLTDSMGNTASASASG